VAIDPVTGALGASDDTYRIVGTDADPGRTALLSPDGDRIAFAAGDRVRVADLRTGRTRTLDPPDAAVDDFRPAAWLPGGRGLVTLSITYADDPTKQGIVKRLSTVDLVTGASAQFAESTWSVAPSGFAVAVSPDGRRIAYQFSDFITVYDRTTGAKHRFTLPRNDFLLAGKGAWTPDGRSLAVAARDSEAGRWRLWLLDSETGVEHDPANRPSLAGVALIRLLGWHAMTGRPVVAGYLTEYGDPLRPDLVQSVGVYELDTVASRTLLPPVDGIAGIDVADLVVRGGLTRPDTRRSRSRGPAGLRSHSPPLA
jgi:WD40 repeat protein